MDEKKRMRERTMHNLLSLSDDTYIKKSAEIAEQLYKQPFWTEATSIGITISRKREVLTHTIIEQAWREGKQVAVPRVDQQTHTMTFYRINSFSNLEETFFGLKEPKTDQCDSVPPREIETLIVPGLAFDSQGYRLGFGGGYYDRFLEQYQGDTVALAFECQMVLELPIENHDIPVRYLITPKGRLR